MRTKLLAARAAIRSGTNVIITSGTVPQAILRAAQGEAIGTYFPAQTSPEGRRRWLATGIAGRAILTIDQGATQALTTGGKSLLAAGVRAIHGHFLRGDPVQIRSHDNQIIASGLVNYDATDLQRIAGHHSDEIPTILGFTYGPEVVHRNNLALLQ
jgi:glutamate 5-kinase